MEKIMKLYDNHNAPSPRRVRIFIAEKGIEIPLVQVNIKEGEQYTPQFLAKNPMSRVPVLELEDGVTICDSMAICRYLEALYPKPNLMGEDALETAIIEQQCLRVNEFFYGLVGGAFRNTHDFFKGKIEQFPEYGQYCHKGAEKFLEYAESALAQNEYIAANRYTLADIMLQVAIDFAKLINLNLTPQHENLNRWYDHITARKSSQT